jgi:hypothetical protein
MRSTLTPNLSEASRFTEESVRDFMENNVELKALDLRALPMKEARFVIGAWDVSGLNFKGWVTVTATPLRCAWRGCQETCTRAEGLPEGWVFLVTFRGTRTPGVLDFLKDKTQRDAALCAWHADELEGLLFPI